MRSFYGRFIRGGRIYTVAGNGSGAFSATLRDGIPALQAPVVFPSGVAIGQAGSLLIAATFQGRVRVVAERAGRLYGRAMRAGDIYTIAGDGSGGTPTGGDGDGGPAVKASLGAPTGVAADNHGNVLIADAQHGRVRDVAEQTGRFYGRAMKAGDIYTIADDGANGFSGDGGLAVKAELNVPSQVAVDQAGNVLITDALNSRIRAVAVSTGTFYGLPMRSGRIYTIAGDGTPGNTGDGEPATAAEVSFPADVAVDANGNVALADQCQIRVVAARTGMCYGQHMLADDIYTVAGGGTCGFAGDAGPARQA